MSEMYSVPEVALMLGRGQGLILDHVRRRKLGRNLGRQWVLSEDDIAVIRAHLRDRPGRPRKERP